MNDQDKEKKPVQNEPPKQPPVNPTGHIPTKKPKKPEDDDGDPKIKWYVMISVGLGVVIILLLLILLVQCSSEPEVVNPDFSPKETQKNLEPLPDDGEEKLEAAEGGGAVVLDYNDKVVIDLSDNIATLDFANPAKSTQDMLFQIVIEDVVIAESGRIPTGYELKKLELSGGSKELLKEGKYKGKFVIFYYDPVSNERAMVNSEGAISITVYP